MWPTKYSLSSMVSLTDTKWQQSASGSSPGCGFPAAPATAGESEVAVPGWRRDRERLSIRRTPGERTQRHNTPHHTAPQAWHESVAPLSALSSWSGQSCALSHPVWPASTSTPSPRTSGGWTSWTIFLLGARSILSGAGTTALLLMGNRTRSSCHGQ